MRDELEMGICKGCNQHRFTLIGGYCDWCRVSGKSEEIRLREAMESLDILLADDVGLVKLVQARMVVEKALCIHEQRTEERRISAAGKRRKKSPAEWALVHLLAHIRKVEKWPKTAEHLSLVTMAEDALLGGK